MNEKAIPDDNEKMGNNSYKFSIDQASQVDSENRETYYHIFNFDFQSRQKEQSTNCSVEVTEFAQVSQDQSPINALFDSQQADDLREIPREYRCVISVFDDGGEKNGQIVGKVIYNGDGFLAFNIVNPHHPTRIDDSKHYLPGVVTASIVQIMKRGVFAEFLISSSQTEFGENLVNNLSEKLHHRNCRYGNLNYDCFTKKTS